MSNCLHMNIKSLQVKEVLLVGLKNGSIMHYVRTGKSYQDCYINIFVIEYSYIIELAKTLSYFKGIF